MSTTVNIPANPFILVDGSSYLFRAFHALPPLTTNKGQPTGAIFGVVNMLRKLIQQYKPEKMAVVFDSKEKNIRHQLYTPYKANRLVMPSELQQQIEPLYAIIEAMGLPLIMMPGVEADDIIGTLAIKAKKQGLFTLISTGDKDFAQLVEDKIILINTMSNDILDRNRVIEKFEVPPETMVDYLALIGDSVDNIPGVPKVGPKTAVKWLETYKTLDNIIKHAETFPGKVGENLRNSLSDLPLFRQLVTIDTNVSLTYEPKDLSLKTPNNEKLRAVYTEMEFKSWLKDLVINPNLPHEELPTAVKEAIQKKVQHDIILDETQFKDWIKKLKACDVFAFDVETTHLNYMCADLVGVSFAIEQGKAAYVPFGHDYENAPKQLDRKKVLEALKPILESKTILKMGHHLKYDAQVLANCGINLQGIAFDTMLESYVLDSTATRHNMDSLAEKYLCHQTIRYEDVAGKGAKQLTFNQIPIPDAGAYAAEDADVTYCLHHYFWPKLTSIPSLQKVFQEIEMALVPVLIQMERRGVLIDAKLLLKQGKELEKKCGILEKKAYELADEQFNLNSPKQLQDILYQRLKLPILEKTPTGQPSTSESVLQSLAEKYELPKIILEYRSLSKLKSTYTDKLPEQVDPKTGRIHTSYHQAITSTGRLSSTDPNLQNIPIRTAEGRRIRTAFIPEKGYKIVAADYSQIELRIMAHMSKDKALVSAFTQDNDIHTSTAASVFGVALSTVNAEQRRSAKAINFGLIYGMSAFGLSKQLNVHREDAQLYIDQYFACFPEVKLFIDHILKEAKKNGYVETLFGRRLYLPDINSSNMMRRKAAERAAINAPMQGSNADIIKLAMIQLHEWINTTQDQVRMIMQVHDELVFEIKEEILESAIEKIKFIMENVTELSVKLIVGVGVGDNWEEAHR